jgi:hypothetical protein
MRGKLSGATLIPIGVLVAAVAVTVPIVRAIDAPSAEVASIRVEVGNVESQVAELKARQGQGDERWERLFTELGQIRERLGIVESKTTVATKP